MILKIALRRFICSRETWIRSSGLCQGRIMLINWERSSNSWARPQRQLTFDCASTAVHRFSDAPRWFGDHSPLPSEAHQFWKVRCFGLWIFFFWSSNSLAVPHSPAPFEADLHWLPQGGTARGFLAKCDAARPVRDPMGQLGPTEKLLVLLVLLVLVRLSVAGQGHWFRKQVLIDPNLGNPNYGTMDIPGLWFSCAIKQANPCSWLVASLCDCWLGLIWVDLTRWMQLIPRIDHSVWEGQYCMYIDEWISRQKKQIDK